MNQAIEYSEKYTDGEFEYRQVILPREMGAQVKTKGLLKEEEWRALGVTQSRGWTHYGIHKPEPHILLFKRPLGTNPHTGKVEAVLKKRIKFEAEQRRRAVLKS